MTDDLEAHATFRLQPDGRVLGPRLGGGVQAVFAAMQTIAYAELQKKHKRHLKIQILLEVLLLHLMHLKI